MSKKKREYGVPELPMPLNSEIAEFDSFPVIWDTHTHLDMVVRYVENLKIELSETKPDVQIKIPSIASIITDAATVGIRGLFHNACELDDIHAIHEILDEIEENATPIGARFAGACAIHPNEAVLHEAGAGGHPELLEVAKDGLNIPTLHKRHMEFNLDQAISEVASALNSDKRIKMVGETGLDYFRTAPTGIGVQQKSFRAHIAIAKELDLPLQIHDREAHRDILGILDSDGPPQTVVFHSFSGDVEFAKECASRGFKMSFSGPITFKSNDTLREAFWYVWQNAPELLLTETDAPFLTPMPNRGRTNVPAQIPNTLRFISNHFGIELRQLCGVLGKNSETLISENR